MDVKHHERKKQNKQKPDKFFRAQELCESRGGRPGLPVPISHMVSVDVKQHRTRTSVSVERQTLSEVVKPMTEQRKVRMLRTDAGIQGAVWQRLSAVWLNNDVMHGW